MTDETPTGRIETLEGLHVILEQRLRVLEAKVEDLESAVASPGGRTRGVAEFVAAARRAKERRLKEQG